MNTQNNLDTNATNKKTKKSIIRNIIIIAIIAVVCVLAVIFAQRVDKAVKFAYYMNASKWAYIVDDFDEYGDDFQAVAEYCRDFFEDNKDDLKQNFISYYSSSIGPCHLVYDGGWLELPEELQKSVNRLHDAFKYKDSNFDRILYYDGRISFNIDNGAYALVYSFNDSKPTFVMKPDEDIKISVKKINKNWYHVVNNTTYDLPLWMIRIIFGLEPQ